jgi:hypothetical protein
MDEDDWENLVDWEFLEWLLAFEHSRDASSEADERPTSGEYLFYALGQLYARLRPRYPKIPARDYNVEKLARIIGAWHDIEYVQNDAVGVAYHFPNEVLQVNPVDDFPWRLLSVMEWADEQERNDTGSERSGEVSDD